MTSDEMLGLVRDAVAIVMEVDPATVTRETRFDELRADSLALVEIVEIVEERVGRPDFRFEDADLDDMATIGEAVDYAVARL